MILNPKNSDTGFLKHTKAVNSGRELCWMKSSITSKFSKSESKMLSRMCIKKFLVQKIMKGFERVYTMSTGYVRQLFKAMNGVDSAAHVRPLFKARCMLMIF